MTFSIRMATEEDAEELLSIYAPYITDTAVTFVYDVPSVTEFSQSIRYILKRYPYLVAVEDNRIAGYSYASPFNNNAAYAWSATTSIYLRQDYRRKGLGKKLYLALEDILKKQNVINLNASVAYTDVIDTHLDNTSLYFHEALGYKKVVHFTKCGYKFGTWYDMIWMEKIIGEHPAVPEPFIPVTNLRDSFFNNPADRF